MIHGTFVRSSRIDMRQSIDLLFALVIVGVDIYVSHSAAVTDAVINGFEGYVDCSGGSVCSNQINSQHCICKLDCTDSTSCHQNFTWNATICTEGEQCGQASKCYANSECRNSIESTNCTCHEYFTGNGTVCIDIDECKNSPCHVNATCENLVPKYSCTCENGFTGNGHTCTDINECEQNRTCDGNATCTNTVGSYNCQCNLGFSGNGTQCEALDICIWKNPCDVNASCDSTEGPAHCTCHKGFTGNGTVCEDVNECNTTKPCNNNSICENFAGGYKCICLEGFSGQGNVCEDINECDAGTYSCSENFECVNTVGSYNCFCKTGFIANGSICEALNECERNNLCHVNANCTGTLDDHNCTCLEGFTGDGTHCEDVDECTVPAHKCSENETCENFIGGHRCNCVQGFNRTNSDTCEDLNECTHGYCHKNATCSNSVGSFACLCEVGFTGNGRICEEIDECARDPCHENAICESWFRDFNCSCDVGFSGNGTICKNVNECANTNSPCHGNATCEDSEGSYKCICDKGFTGDGKSCEDISECEISDPCHKHADCTNTIGSYSCSCQSGFEGDGKICKDKNECELEQYECHENASCSNTVGSYDCQCNPGFTGNHTVCQEIDECRDEWQKTTDCPFLKLKESFLIMHNDSQWWTWEYNASRNPCAPHAICHDKIDAFNCTCEEGYTGYAYDICGRAENLRLSGERDSNNRTRNQGHVEIYALDAEFNGWSPDWGRICDPEWKEKESNVVCKQLGYQGVSFLSPESSELNETMLNWVDTIRCDGTESHISQCNFSDFGSANCSGTETVTVVCSNSTKTENGSIEMFYLSRTGRGYNFLCHPWERYRIVKSHENCEKDDRAAAIECTANVNDTTDPSFQMDFNYLMFQEFRCNATVNNLFDELGKDANRTETSGILGDLSALSENFTSDNASFTVHQLSEMTSIINDLTSRETKVFKPSVFFLVWCLNNLDLVLQSGTEKARNFTAEYFNVTEKMRFIHSLNKILSNIRLSEINMTVDTATTILQSIRMSEADKKPIAAESWRIDGRHNSKCKLSRPDNATDDETFVNVVFATNATVYPDYPEKDTSIKEAVGLSFSGKKKDNLSGDVELEIPFDYSETPKSSGTPGTLYFHRCVRLLNNGTWSTDGSKTKLVNNTYTTCNTKYNPGVTAFSVLVKVYPVADSVPLGIVGTVGCVLSSIFLFAAIIIYIAFKNLRINLMNQIHIHLCVCLLGFYITYLVGVQRNQKYVPCMVVAAFMQFLLLSSWGWMLVESITMFRKFWFPRKKIGDYYILICSLIIYITFGTAVSVNAYMVSQKDAKNWEMWHLAFSDDVSFRPSEYVGDIACWLHKESLHFGFLTPVGIILLCNLVFGFVIIRKITTKMEVRSKKTQTSQNVIRTMTITVLLGLPWIVGVPLILSDLKSVNDVFGWLFTILNAYQGVIVFAVLCVLRKDARGMWMAKVDDIKSTLTQDLVSNAKFQSTILSAVLHSTTPKSSFSAEVSHAVHQEPRPDLKSERETEAPKQDPEMNKMIGELRSKLKK